MMVGNGKTEAQVSEDLEAFLGKDNAKEFARWYGVPLAKRAACTLEHVSLRVDPRVLWAVLPQAVGDADVSQLWARRRTEARKGGRGAAAQALLASGPHPQVPWAYTPHTLGHCASAKKRGAFSLRWLPVCL